MTRSAQVTVALLAALALPPARQWLESSMTLHMLVQFPLLVAAGFLLARTIPAEWRLRADPWNDHGIAGLLACAAILMVLMIPRVLDLALADLRVESAKWLALLAAGAALQLSWRRAGLLVQAFFLGNLLPMTAAVGQLYQDAPVRLCNAYLLDDQVRLGQGLVILAAAGGVAAVVHVLRRWSGCATDAPSLGRC